LKKRFKFEFSKAPKVLNRFKCGLYYRGLGGVEFYNNIVTIIQNYVTNVTHFVMVKQWLNNVFRVGCFSSALFWPKITSGRMLSGSTATIKGA